MRRVIPVVVLAALVLAGCGSSSSRSANPVNTALSYFPAQTPFVLTIAADPNATKSASKLSALISSLKGLQSAGTHDRAKLYSAPSAALAIDGATVVFAPTVASLTTALDRHAHGGGVSSAAFSNATSGLPQDSLIEAFGNLTGVLSQPSTAKARRVPWVAALQSYAVGSTPAPRG